FQQQTAGPFSMSTDTRQRSGYNLWPSEIEALQALCRTGSQDAFSVDTARLHAQPLADLRAGVRCGVLLVRRGPDRGRSAVRGGLVIFPYGETVVRIRRTPGGRDPFGDPIGDTEERVDIPGCGVAPRQAGEQIGAGRIAVTSGVTLYVPPG